MSNAISITFVRFSSVFPPPTGPLFNDGDADRLRPEDAVYTEALITNGGNLGFMAPNLAHASFYPNGGSSQPGCGIDASGACAHERSNLFYSESVRAGTFTARQCGSFQEIVDRNCPGTGVTAPMGGDGPKNINGVFFLTTNAASPFAQG